MNSIFRGLTLIPRWIRDRELIAPLVTLAFCSFYIFLCFTAPFPKINSSVGSETVDAEAPNRSGTSNSFDSLDWLVGNWRLVTPTAEMKWAVSFAANHHYLVIQEELRLIGSEEKFGALRIVMRDPIAPLFNVSFFGSDGSFGTGFLQNGDDFGAPIDVNDGATADAEWIGTGRILLPNGEATTMTELFYPLPGGGFQWKSVSRTIANESLPDIGPITAEAIPPFTTDVHVLTTPLPALLGADE